MLCFQEFWAQLTKKDLRRSSDRGSGLLGESRCGVRHWGLNTGHPSSQGCALAPLPAACRQPCSAASTSIVQDLLTSNRTRSTDIHLLSPICKQHQRQEALVVCQCRDLPLGFVKMLLGLSCALFFVPRRVPDLGRGDMSTPASSYLQTFSAFGYLLMPTLLVYNGT